MVRGVGRADRCRVAVRGVLPGVPGGVLAAGPGRVRLRQGARLGAGRGGRVGLVEVLGAGRGRARVPGGCRVGGGPPVGEGADLAAAGAAGDGRAHVERAARRRGLRGLGGPDGGDVHGTAVPARALVGAGLVGLGLLGLGVRLPRLGLGGLAGGVRLALGGVRLLVARGVLPGGVLLPVVGRELAGGPFGCRVLAPGALGAGHEEFVLAPPGGVRGPGDGALLRHRTRVAREILTRNLAGVGHAYPSPMCVVTLLTALPRRTRPLAPSARRCQRAAVPRGTYRTGSGCCPPLLRRPAPWPAAECATSRAPRPVLPRRPGPSVPLVRISPEEAPRARVRYNDPPAYRAPGTGPVTGRGREALRRAGRRRCAHARSRCRWTVRPTGAGSRRPGSRGRSGRGR